jgi:uroporphyrinogen-III decarboxylase
MTSRERILRALNLEKPDRLPVTVHQWQRYHLDTFMGGVTALEAFKQVGLDAQIQCSSSMERLWLPGTLQSLQWIDRSAVVKADPDDRVVHHTVTTPGGVLTYKMGSDRNGAKLRAFAVKSRTMDERVTKQIWLNLAPFGSDRKTTWVTEYMIKQPGDLDIIDKYMPVPKLDRAFIQNQYDLVGDAGILRGFVWGCQAGAWQHACYLKAAEDLIMDTMEEPEWVHALLRSLMRKKLQFMDESLRGAKFDLIETGGGAASDTLISPKIHAEFCLPYDKQMHDALRAINLRSTYHTCGGMMFILDLLAQNGADASETLSPPGMGGNITEPEKIRAVFGGRRAMLGGLDQFNILGTGTPEQIRAETRRLFEGFGKNGGYICSACDHFFDAPVENLKAFAAAGRECVY